MPLFLRVGLGVLVSAGGLSPVQVNQDLRRIEVEGLGSDVHNPGRAPARTMALAEAKKLKAVVITVSPG